MKVVILAGGKGTRLFEETITKPKPLVKIGNYPIIWHIMKIYSKYGFNDFVVCTGYKHKLLEKFFTSLSENWNIKSIYTGLETQTGGRLKRIQKFVENDTFFFTYSDTVNDLNIQSLLKFHEKMKTLATVTACHPSEKYGIMKLKNNLVLDFKEKPPNKEWVNGGFFVLEPEIFDLITNDKTIWERKPLEILTRKKQISAFYHTGFYQPMDTLSDKNYLENLWNSNKAPWKVW